MAFTGPANWTEMPFYFTSTRYQIIRKYNEQLFTPAGTYAEKSISFLFSWATVNVF